tara:strand:+ start:2911 stop:3096 length:186 start_codon:yes stop_codon:yes gene_type:complete
VFFDANHLDGLSSNKREFERRAEYRNFLINHLNQSLFASSPVGRLISYIKAFLERYVELKN